MNHQTYQLKNGIRLIHKPDNTKVAYAGIIINTGTRDEDENQQGMAHFVEHMLFKGTAKRRSYHIINRLEDVGGELNAYTNKEETVVYAAFLKEHTERTMELISDIIFNSVFPENEIEKEIAVVLDEIESYNDSPSELIYDEFEELIFDGNAIGRNILGKTEIVEKYTRKDVISFVQNKYYTDEMVFFVMGDIPFKKIIHWGEKYLGGHPASTRSHKRTTPLILLPQAKTIERDTHQLHFMLGNRAYALNDENRLPLILLNNIIGGPGMNSLLNLALRERNGLAYNIESNYTAYTDTGVFSIYLGSNPRYKEKCIKLVNNELKKIKENKITDTKLAKYKKQLMGQIAIGSQNKENEALGLGKSLLRFNQIETTEEVCKKIDAISAQKLQQIANEILIEKNLSSLMYD
jgi:predicted Zn-dependent peptidase